MASGGADGVVKLWSASDAGEQWTCLYTLEHATFEGRPKKQDDEPNDPPQIYALQFLSNWKGIADVDPTSNNFLMTSSDDFVHLWEVSDVQVTEGKKSINLVEVFSFRFTCLDDFGYGVSLTTVTKSGLAVGDKSTQESKRLKTDATNFGGDRNPHNIVFVFDASYCSANGLLGVALSDGSLRLVNGRGVCVCPITLPGNSSHLTSFGWDSTGKRLASCVATGHLILWELDIQDDGRVTPQCKAVLEGGHISGRPLYGAAYCGGDNEDLTLSWGVDGRLCLWDSHSSGNINAPLSTLVAQPNYPIFAVDISRQVEDSDASGDAKLLARIGCGGGRDGGFLGVPVHLYDVTRGIESSMRRKQKAEEKNED